jgi:putative DNA methylase
VEEQEIKMVVRIIQSILRHIDQQEVSSAAKIETRNREVHLPPVSIYRWWARRTEAINGALVEAAARELGRTEGMLIADPFAGGGVIPLAALMRGHSVYAQDLNPWVGKGLSAMLGLPSAQQIRQAREYFSELAGPIAAKAYRTKFSDGGLATISQTIRVAVAHCSHCGGECKLFPHALVSLTRRKELKGGQAILACPRGHLFVGRDYRTSHCPHCGDYTYPTRTYLPKRILTCQACGHAESLEENAKSQNWSWKVVLVERTDGKRRELAFPTPAELNQAADAKWRAQRQLGAIPKAHETKVLRRHGFENWADIYPNRQRAVTERLLQLSKVVSKDRSIQSTVEMAVLGSTEMAGLLSRWDRYYLKSFESMASHRFNFSTLVVEPNVLGAGAAGRGTTIRRLLLFEKAAKWMHEKGLTGLASKPMQASRPRFKRRPKHRAVIAIGSSDRMLLPAGCVDAVLTDPPYHDDVQYHELSLPFRTWAKLTTRRGVGEAVVIPHSKNLTGHRKYRGTLTKIFTELNRVLKPGGHLLFSYANREPAAWVNLFAALRAAKFAPVGYTIVHSENESEHSKRRGRACSLDLILDLVPSSQAAIKQWRAKPVFRTDEEGYLIAVGEAFLGSGALMNGWEIDLVKRLKSEIFVQDATRSAPQRSVNRHSRARVGRVPNP